MARVVDDQGNLGRATKPLGVRVYEPDEEPDATLCDNTLIAINYSPTPRLQFSNGEEWLTVSETETVLGETETIGPSSIVASGSTALSGSTVIRATAATLTGEITRLRIGVSAAATVTVASVTLNGNGTLTIGSQRLVTLAAGLNDVAVNCPITAGQYPAVYLNGTNIYFQNSVNPEGLTYWYHVGLTGTGTSKSSSLQHRLEFAFDLTNGLASDVALTAFGGGLNLLAEVDNSGTSDVTTSFTKARALHPAPYVPPGSYAVTSLTASGSGLWGPGKVFRDSQRFFLPPKPQSTSLLSRLRLALSEQIGSASPVVLIGDSISHWAFATAGSDHWFNMFTRFANAGIAKDEPIMTGLRPYSSYTTSFYGVTTSGSVSTGTVGPLGETLILASGASMSFTGAYEQVDVFYTQKAAAGSIAFAYNGGAAYKTVNAAGSTVLDSYTGPSLTGQASSGTYTITASGGAVEITGLVRLAVKTASTPPRLLTMRAAHGSYQFQIFDSARVTSILEQASYAGGAKPLVIVALGINDSFTINPATIRTNQGAMLDLLTAGGVEQIYGIPPIKPSSAWDATYTGGRTFEPALGAILDEYRERSIPILPVTGVDWVNESLLSDGLHPNDAGNEKLAQIVIEALAGV